MISSPEANFANTRMCNPSRETKLILGNILVLNSNHTKPIEKP